MRTSVRPEPRRAGPAAARDAPFLASCEQLQERQAGLWWGSHLFSAAVHGLLAVWIAHTGVIVLDYTSRFGYGAQFGQAVLLASPLFELGQRDPLRGREKSIPLSALLPQEKLYAPDLRRLAAAREAAPAGAAAQKGTEKKIAFSEPSASAISVPFAGGGGALPGGTLPERVSAGPATPFDQVPPSNTRARRPGAARTVRVRVGDAGAPGGGVREGLRLPATPARVGISVEAVVDARVENAMEEWLRVLLARLRRASFELLPDRRDLGPPGLTTLAVEADAAGRMLRPRVQAGSGNAALDRLALALAEKIPAYHPLPPGVLDETVTVVVQVRYFPPQ